MFSTWGIRQLERQSCTRSHVIKQVVKVRWFNYMYLMSLCSNRMLDHSYQTKTKTKCWVWFHSLSLSILRICANGSSSSLVACCPHWLPIKGTVLVLQLVKFESARHLSRSDNKVLYSSVCFAKRGHYQISFPSTHEKQKIVEQKLSISSHNRCFGYRSNNISEASEVSGCVNEILTKLRIPVKNKNLHFSFRLVEPLVHWSLRNSQ